MRKQIEFIVATRNQESDTHFFRMLSEQRNVDFGKIGIIAVCARDDDTHYDCPCEIDMLRTDNLDPRDMFNAGLRASHADWVMFCYAEDGFATVFSLFTILEVLPIRNADVLWMESYREERHDGKTPFVNHVKEGFNQISAKLYRREYLTENNLLVPDVLQLNEYAFNDIILCCTTPDRVKKIETQLVPYRVSERNIGAFSKDFFSAIIPCGIHIADDLERRNLSRQADARTLRTMYHAYFALSQEVGAGTPESIDAFARFVRSHPCTLPSVSETERDVIWNDAVSDTIGVVQNLWNAHRIERMLPKISRKAAEEWIAGFMRSASESPEKPRNERVVVYCGTRNTYEHIATSIKSLLTHTPVDDVYVLAEDDAIDILPDCVRVLNVSGQQYFSPDGPNYANAWTYMCMMRAAYHHIFPAYSRVLSLDIDTVITDDISDLFDTDLSGYYYAGVRETARSDGHGDYCNFGIILLNLDALRDGTGDRVIDALNTSRFDCPEQSAFHAFCTGHIRLLPSDFNVTPYSHLTDPPERERIVHYAGIKYWKCFDLVQQYADLDWNTVTRKQKLLKGELTT